MRLMLFVLSTGIMLTACGPGSLNPVPTGEASPQRPLQATDRLMLGTANMTEGELSSDVLTVSADAMAQAIAESHGQSVEQQPPRLMRVADLRHQGQFLGIGISDSDQVLVRAATGTFSGSAAGAGGTLLPQPFHRLRMTFDPRTGESIGTEWAP